MKLLLTTAWQNRRYRQLASLVILTMVLLTIASQLEIFTLGLITQKKSTFEGYGLLAPVATFFDETLGLSGNPFHLALLLLSVATVKAIVLFIYRYSARLAAIHVSADLRLRYFEHIQAMPMAFYQSHNIGTLSSRAVGDAASIADALNACLVNYLQTPFTVFSTLLLCFFLSWKLSLIIFLGFPLLVYPILFLAQRVRRISKQILSNQEHFASVLIDYLAGIQTVKVFAMEQFSLDKYRQHNRQMAALERKSARYDLSSRPIIHTLGMFFLALALLSGLYLLEMEVSQVIVFCGLLYVFYEPIKKFAEENSHIQRGVAAAERMCEVLEQRSHLCDAPDAVPLTSFHRNIELRDVWFRYADDWVLRGVNLTIEKGSMVALVGPTGSGKSTLAQLLPRLYDIERGTISIDGLPLAAYQQRSLRELIGFVPQRPFLFLDTVGANIAFGRPYTPAAIVDAARRAHAHDFITQLPQGYDTLLIDAGGNLSGGQQQRLAIARALIKEAPILVLDEATSSLDAASEQHIKLALRELRGQITQIIIAHRLSTIEDADKIAYMQDGTILDVGTREELLDRCPPFKAMWDIAHRTVA